MFCNCVYCSTLKRFEGLDRSFLKSVYAVTHSEAPTLDPSKKQEKKDEVSSSDINDDDKAGGNQPSVFAYVSHFQGDTEQ